MVGGDIRSAKKVRMMMKCDVTTITYKKVSWCLMMKCDVTIIAYKSKLVFDDEM